MPGPGSGIQVQGDVAKVIKDNFKGGKTVKGRESDVLIYKITEDCKSVALVEQVSFNRSKDELGCTKMFAQKWNEFVATHMKDEVGFSAFVVMCLEYTKKDSDVHNDKVMLIKFCPQNDKAKTKMLMASTYDTVKKAVDISSDAMIEVDCGEDAMYEALLSKVK